MAASNKISKPQIKLRLPRLDGKPLNTWVWWDSLLTCICLNKWELNKIHLRGATVLVWLCCLDAKVAFPYTSSWRWTSFSVIFPNSQTNSCGENPTRQVRPLSGLGLGLGLGLGFLCAVYRNGNGDSCGCKSASTPGSPVLRVRPTLSDSPRCLDLHGYFSTTRVLACMFLYYAGPSTHHQTKGESRSSYVCCCYECVTSTWNWSFLLMSLRWSFYIWLLILFYWTVFYATENLGAGLSNVCLCCF